MLHRSACVTQFNSHRKVELNNLRMQGMLVSQLKTLIHSLTSAPLAGPDIPCLQFLKFIPLILITLSFFGNTEEGISLKKHKNSDVAIEMRVKELLNRMSLEEKVQQLGGMAVRDDNNPFGSSDPNFGTTGNARLGIPPLIMGHGITGVRAGRNPDVKATYFATPIAIGSSWDPILYGRVGTALAKELRAFGQNLNLGPTLNVIRHPLGGRNWESFSEDPYLISQLIVPFVKAQQTHGIISGPKHFVVNNQEKHRFDINNIVDERALREIYLPGFKAAVVDGGALNVMCAYNRINGTQACEHKRLLTDILRNEWGFRGFVLSDFARAMHSTAPSALAGMNVEMHATKFYGKNLVNAVTQKLVAENVIDQLLSQKLFAMFKVGVFDDFHNYPKSIVHSKEHQEIALEVAQKSPVLLKNNVNLLPLNVKKYKSIAVIGPNAKPFPKLGEIDYAFYLQGGGSGRNWYKKEALISPFTGIREVIPKRTKISYAAGVKTSNIRENKKLLLQKNEILIKEASELAATTDLVILIVGLSGFDESEGRDRDSARLPGAQETLIRSVVKKNPNSIVINIAGSYVDMSHWIGSVETLLFVPYSGEKIGRAIGQILVGEINPSGKLPFSYPRSPKDYPADSFYEGEAFSKSGVSNHYAESIYVGYRYFDKIGLDVLYPFGYGLNYSKFHYQNLHVKPLTPSTFSVHFEIENRSSTAGTDVPQLYISHPTSDVDRPVRELKAFKRVHVGPNNKKEVEFQLNRSAFSYFHPEKRRWTVQDGIHKILLGTSSRDIKIEQTITLGDPSKNED